MSNYNSDKPKDYTGWIVAGICCLLIVGFFIILLTTGNKKSKESNKGIFSAQKAVVYKTATCGCCGVYSKYLPEEGMQTTVRDISSNELDQMRVKLGIPDDLKSCHITVMGDYFVSGHVPVEAISKLITEKPDIAGIALAGMPSGTPGMPGPKTVSWNIKAIGADKTVSEFIKL
ncbi:MAG: hypothetical protein M1324_04395 [Patescibacteria group bacterium]|nr:hypothetical protein [Patescibacteria group bacterium]